jgi:hypothetical protein
LLDPNVADEIWKMFQISQVPIRLIFWKLWKVLKLSGTAVRRHGQPTKPRVNGLISTWQKLHRPSANLPGH